MATMKSPRMFVAFAGDSGGKYSEMYPGAEATMMYQTPSAPKIISWKIWKNKAACHEVVLDDGTFDGTEPMNQTVNVERI